MAVSMRITENHVATDYLSAGLDRTSIRAHVARIVQDIREHAPRAQAIAFRGISGALLAPIVALELDLPLIAVRKAEKNHPFQTIETLVDRAVSRDEPLSYVVIDDLVLTKLGAGQASEEVRCRGGINFVIRPLANRRPIESSYV